MFYIETLGQGSVERFTLSVYCRHRNKNSSNRDVKNPKHDPLKKQGIKIELMYP